MGKNRNQWRGPEALDTESGSPRGNCRISVSRVGVVGADVALLVLLGYQGWWRAIERRAFFGEGEIEHLKMEVAGRECVIGEWVIVLRL